MKKNGVPFVLIGRRFEDAFNDVIAWEAAYVLQKYGYRVPGDSAIIGFDNIQSRMFREYRQSARGSRGWLPLRCTS